MGQRLWPHDGQLFALYTTVVLCKALALPPIVKHDGTAQEAELEHPQEA